MWQIIKTEMQYTKLAILIAYSIGLLLLVFSNFYSLIANTLTVLITAIIFIGVQRFSEKRDRYYARLPITLKSIGLARVLFVLILQSVMILLWLLSFWHEPPVETGKAIYTMIGMSAFWMGTIIIILLFYDLGHFGTRTYRMLFLAAFFLTAIGYKSFIFNRFDESSEQQIVDKFLFYQSPVGAAIISSIFIGLLFLSVLVFARRRSYLA